MYTPTHSSFATFGRNDGEEKFTELGDGRTDLFSIIKNGHFWTFWDNEGHFRSFWTNVGNSSIPPSEPFLRREESH